MTNKLLGKMVLYWYIVNKKRLKSYNHIAIALVIITLAAFPSNQTMAQMEFVENKGQWPAQVSYKGDHESGAFFIESKGFTVSMSDPKELLYIHELTHPHREGDNAQKVALPFGNGKTLTLHSHAYKVTFEGASSNVTVVPDKLQQSYNNYYLGNDPTKWASGCRIYGAVTYQNMYPGVDVRYYSDAAGRLKYDIIVKPGADASRVVLAYEGVDKLSVKNQELVIGTSVGEARELYPYTYEIGTAKRRELKCRYVVRGNKVRFNVEDRNPDATLVIDPSLVFSSLTGSRQDNWGFTATFGPDGSFFAGGVVFANTNGYPVSPGAYQQTFGGGQPDDQLNLPYDMAIMKLSSNGSTRLYATYLGGLGNEQPHSMVCDAAGNLTVAGRSSSSNYPRSVPQIGAGGLYDIVVTRFNAAGTALLGSVKMGGTRDDGVNIRGKYVLPDGIDVLRRNYGDDARSEVILDGANNILLASCSQSNNFPTSPTSVQPTFGGARQDGVIIKFSPDLSTVLFSSYFGGSGDDACFVLSTNPLTGNIYVAGATNSGNLPGDKTGVLFPNNQGSVDGFITQLLPDGSSILKTTYAGTPSEDVIYGIQFDRKGFPYIMGTSIGSWPILNAAYNRPGSRQFISKLQPDLSAFVYSTTYGTLSPIPNISPVAFLVDRCENVYVSGWGGRVNTDKGFPSAGTANMDTTINFSGHRGDGNDFYFMVLEKNATRLLMGAFFGQLNGQFDDHVDGGTSRFDANGVIYQAMCANCAGGTIFPTTPGVFGPTNGTLGPNGTNGCNQAAVKIEMNFAGVGAAAQASINGVKYDTAGCTPLKVDFTDTLLKGKTFIWDFGDGSPKVTLTGSPDTSHIFLAPGNYRVMLVAIDSTTCNIADTAYTIIRAGNNRAFLSFNAVKLPPCTNLTYEFTNTSTASSSGFGARSFVWDYGDGSPRDTVGLNPPRRHTYPSTGTYRVKLFVIDTIFCNSPDSIERTIRISETVRAQFNTPARGCVPHTANFTNTSLGGIDFVWDFGDGSPPSTDPDPSHVYNNVGTYTVKLIATDTTTCNRIDSAFFTIQVFPIPTAGYTFSPNPAQENRPTQFTNTSIGATSYLWRFGDNETSIETNPLHQYNSTGLFRACLFATNEAGCTDSICQNVPALIVPVLDVPNAFTPGKFGSNSVVRVQGFGIGTMTWTIFNRWGQVVFKTNNRRDGWDGTFKGVLQPMDVYTYTLDVLFTDGKKLRKTGDISLLR
jgi:gliding motility-associated-like protein